MDNAVAERPSKRRAEQTENLQSTAIRRKPVIGSRVVYWGAVPVSPTKYEAVPRCADVVALYPNGRIDVVYWDGYNMPVFSRTITSRPTPDELGIDYSAEPSFGCWSWPADEYA